MHGIKEQNGKKKKNHMKAPTANGPNEKTFKEKKC